MNRKKTAMRIMKSKSTRSRFMNCISPIILCRIANYMGKRKLRVGFDLDGVLLYNPARIARPLVSFIKRHILKRKGTTFFIPQTPLHKLIWKFFHYSSLFVDPGVKHIKDLISQNDIEAYIVSGRYGFLVDDFEKWLQKMETESYFKNALHNKDNQQPYLFKQKVIKDLDLDVFIEDNWDIVQKLQGSRTKIFWLYNIFDRGLPYQYKFATLTKALKYIKKNLSEKLF